MIVKYKNYEIELIDNKNNHNTTVIIICSIFHNLITLPVSNY